MYCLSLLCSGESTDDSLRREKMIRQNLSGEETKVASNLENDTSILASIRSFLLSFLTETKTPPDLDVIKAVVDEQSERCRLRSLGLELVSCFLTEVPLERSSLFGGCVVVSSACLDWIGEHDEEEYQRRLETLKLKTFEIRVEDSLLSDTEEFCSVLQPEQREFEWFELVFLASSNGKTYSKCFRKNSGENTDLDAKQSEDMPPPPPRHDVTPLLRATISAIRCCGS